MRVPVGIGPPNVLEIPITSTSSVLDLTTVTAVTFRVWNPNGTEVTSTFTGSKTYAAASSIAATASYAFTGAEFTGASVNPATMLGRWDIAAYLTVPGGTVPCQTVHFEVSTEP